MPVSSPQKSFLYANRTIKSKSINNEQSTIESGNYKKGLLSVAKNTYAMRHIDANKGKCECESS